MPKIKIDTEGLKNNSENIGARIAELQNLNSRLESLITRIADSWEGNASEAYINLLRSYAEHAKNMINILNEYKKYIDKTVVKFSELDRNKANIVKSV